MGLRLQNAMFSYAAIACGGAGIFIALLVVYAGPFSPQPDIGTSIGEIAGNMRAAACGMAISVGAIFVQVVHIAVLIIAGVMLLIGIMQNLDSILGS